jgi:hypothetical protein
MRYRFVATLGSGALLVLAIVGIAVAATPKAGYVYFTGQGSPAVSFRAVSGTKLTGFSAGLAVRCKTRSCGGFGGIKSFTRSSVTVSATGTFTVSGAILSVKNKKLGTETVTGKFVSPTKVTGTVTTHATLGSYVGVTKSYTATGTPPQQG